MNCVAGKHFFILFFIIINYYLNETNGENEHILIGSDGSEYYWSNISVDSYLHARQHCIKSSRQLILMIDISKFNKALLAHVKRSKEITNFNITFYVNETVEATVDHPNSAEGEKICFILSKDLTSNRVAIQINEAEYSCSEKVNAVFCKGDNSLLTTTSTTPIQTEDSNQNLMSEKICLHEGIFFVINGFFIVIVASLLILLVFSMTKNHRARLRLMRVLRERREILNDEWSKDVGGGQNTNIYSTPLNCNNYFKTSSPISSRSNCLFPALCLPPKCENITMVQHAQNTQHGGGGGGGGGNNTPRLQVYSTNLTAVGGSRGLDKYHAKLNHVNEGIDNNEQDGCKGTGTTRASGFL